jgi:hypothetical protein
VSTSLFSRTLWGVCMCDKCQTKKSMAVFVFSILGTREVVRIFISRFEFFKYNILWAIHSNYEKFSLTTSSSKIDLMLICFDFFTSKLVPLYLFFLFVSVLHFLLSCAFNFSVLLYFGFHVFVLLGFQCILYFGF